jgi:hypothetical protein
MIFYSFTFYYLPSTIPKYVNIEPIGLSAVSVAIIYYWLGEDEERVYTQPLGGYRRSAADKAAKLRNHIANGASHRYEIRK